MQPLIYNFVTNKQASSLELDNRKPNRRTIRANIFGKLSEREKIKGFISPKNLRDSGYYKHRQVL